MMRSVLACVGIATILLASGCKRAEPPKTPNLPIPQCKEIPPEGVKSFTRLVHAMDRAGDLPAVTQTFLDYRKALETQLAKRDPALVQKLKPVLDKEFSQDTLRARAACGFAAIAARGGAVGAIDAWSKSPEMHAVNVSIWNRAPVPSEEDPVPNTAKRIDRMRDIYTAMALEQVEVNRTAGLGPEPAALVAALDAAVLSLPAAPPKERIDRQTVLLDKWLIPALAKTSDKDIETFMDFAESPTGADYYVALAAAYDFRNGDWYSQLYQALREAAAPGELPGGAPGGKDAVIAQARQLLTNVGTTAAAAQALAMLQEVERIDPRNALVRRLVGEAAIKSAPTVPLAQDQLRAVIDAPSYYIADQELAKSLELAPDDADALMWLGRLRYLQGRDAEAGPLFQRAAEINEEHPYLNLFNADLIYETGDYTKAMRYYQAALAKPEGLPFVYDTTMSHLMSAMRRANRAADFPRVADAFLAQHPQYWNVRLDYADFLMATPGIKSDRIVAVVDPVPDTWLPARKFAVLSAALVRKSTERLDKKTGAPVGDSQAAMTRAITLNPDPTTLAEAICRAGADAKIAQFYVDASTDAKATSTALTVCALRWQRIDILRVISTAGDPIALSRPQPSLLGDTPLCYAAGTKNVKGFVALAKLQVNPGQRCNDGNSVSERLSRLAYGGDPSIPQMQSILTRFYRKP